MDVATKFPTVGNLDISPKALYLLTAPSTPDEVKEEATEIAEAGETVNQKNRIEKFSISI